jgi:hypothetical protein
MDLLRLDPRRQPSGIWKIRPSGGEPVQVTRHGGFYAFETPDGQWLYVCYPPKLSRMRPDGSEETPLRNDVAGNFWVIGGHSVYVLSGRPGPGMDLLRAPFGGSVFETVYDFSDANVPTSGGTALGVPDDESYLIYRRQTRLLTTLMLIENFR